jgi:type IV fimbrial biogenesis protein FimT
MSRRSFNPTRMPMREPTFEKTHGFTLIELLVVIGVSGILLAVALPAFSTFVLNERQSAQANSMAFTLEFARSEAIKQDNANGIQVCVSSDGKTCTTGTWSQGWIVVPGGGGTPLMSVPALGAGNTLTAAGVTSTTFAPNGLPSTNMTFTLCDRRGGTAARYIELGTWGRLYISPTPGINPLTNKALTCP